MNRKLLLLVACACVPAVSQAQSEFRWVQFSKRIEGSQKVSPLQMDAFGEAIRLSNGALSFSNTDVSLPGNNALPVAVSRSYEVQSRKVAGEFMFGDWDVELGRRLRLQASLARSSGDIVILAADAAGR